MEILHTTCNNTQARGQSHKPVQEVSTEHGTGASPLSLVRASGSNAAHARRITIVAFTILFAWDNCG